MRVKPAALSLAILALLGLGVGALAIWQRGRGAPAAAQPPVVRGGSGGPTVGAIAPAERVDAPRDPRPGQGRAALEVASLPGGAISGHVINGATGDGIAGAELTFTGEAGAITARSGAAGEFELAPPAPGRFALTAASAPGF